LACQFCLFNSLLFQDLRSLPNPPAQQARPDVIKMSHDFVMR